MKLQKLNGFNGSLHLYQIISYIFFFSIFVTYFAINFSLSSETCKIIGASLEIISAIVVVISGYITTATDPSDTYLTAYRQARWERRNYEPESREFYCSADHTYVKPGSKHCRRCNRCTEGFDHHCKWVNNDVGKANYKAFFILISSVMVFLTVYIVFGIMLTISFANDTKLMAHDLYIFGHDSSQILAVMVILWIFMVLAGVFLMLDANLVFFHIFLMSKGLTTFQYITAVEERKEYQKEMEYAKKILGENRKTYLDFILCLKKRDRTKEHNKSIVAQKATPQGLDLELAQATDANKKRHTETMEDKKLSQCNEDCHEDRLNVSIKEKVISSEVPSADDFKNASNNSQNRSTNPLLAEKGSADTIDKDSATKRENEENFMKPILINIEKDQGKKKIEVSSREQSPQTKSNTKTKAQEIADQYNLEIGLERSPEHRVINIGSSSTTKKKLPNFHVSLNMELDESIKNKLKKETPQKNSNRALAYSIEKEKEEFVRLGISNPNTQRSNHTPQPGDVKKNNLVLDEAQTYKLHGNGNEIKEEIDYSEELPRSRKNTNDIAVETFRDFSEENIKNKE